MTDGEEVPRVCRGAGGDGCLLKLPRRDAKARAVIPVQVHLCSKSLMHQLGKVVHAIEVRRLGGGEGQDTAVVDEKQVVLAEEIGELVQRQTAVGQAPEKGMGHGLRPQAVCLSA